LYLNHFSTKNIPASLFSKLHSATFNFGFLKGFLVPKLMMSAWKNCGLVSFVQPVLQGLSSTGTRNKRGEERGNVFAGIISFSFYGPSILNKK